MQNNFEITVVERPALSLVGIKVKTSMPDAKKDCPALWEKFVPHMQKLFPLQNPPKHDSYGVSQVLQDGFSFEYWAALEFNQAELPPESAAELLPINLPAGTYAECEVSKIELISAAYEYIYISWLPAHPQYALTHTPCYEYYKPDHMQTQASTIYWPLGIK